MKKFLFLTLNLMVAMTAQASSFVCLETVETAVTQEFEEKGWSYHGADPYNAEELTAMLGNLEDWSTELFQEEAEEIAAYLSQGKYEFYSVTGTGDYSGGFQELIVVDPNDQCGLVARYLTYVE